MDVNENQLLGCSEVCATYHRLKSFRASLLGFLPLASSVGAFTLLQNIPATIPIVSLFSLLFTIGLFVYEIHGKLLVKRLISIGAMAETNLSIEFGQFSKRPKGIGGDTGALVAAVVVYGSVLLLWSYLAFFYKP